MNGTNQRSRNGEFQDRRMSTVENLEEPFGPNEIRYCICNHLACGTIVGYDSKGCPMNSIIMNV